MNSFVRRVYLLALVGILSVFSLSARADMERSPDRIVNDPEVRYGVLPNGLTYYVRENAKPAGMAELRLVVKAGSALEDEDQLGLAHFLEHMLFNGTEKYPGNEIVEVLESFGMEFGPEINAYTTFEETVYRLSVSTEDKDQFDTGFDVLEQWAFHATLAEDEYEKERQVVHEEWRVGRGAQARMRDQTYPVLFKDSRYAERRPIGEVDIILNAPLEALRRFYEDWYRPDLMAIIAVGDFDPDATVSLITERFGTQPNPVPSRPRPEYPIPRHEETLVKVAHDPEATRSSVQLYVKYDTKQADFRSELQGDLAEQLFYVMLNQRLGEVSRKENPPFLYGYGFSNVYNTDTSLAGLAAAVAEEAALEGLKAILDEAERVQRYGFLPSELERAKVDVMSFFENYWKQRNDLDSADFVDSYLDGFLKGDSYPSIDWQWDAVQDLLPLVTLEEVSDAADRLLGDSNRVVLINGPSVPAITNIDDEDILRILRESESRNLEPWIEDKVLGPLVQEEPLPGRIIARSVLPGTDIGVWILSNGARVLYKDTEFRRDEILFRAISPGGASQVDDEAYASSQYATDLVDQGGLADYSLDDLRKILTGKNLEISPFIQESYEGFSGSSTADDLEDLFQLIYLHHAEPRKDQLAWTTLMNRTRESLRNRESSPMTLYEDEFWETVYNDHFRARPMTAERLDDAELDEAFAIYIDRFREAGDFTYIFVGDLDIEELESLTARWLAGLPEANPEESWIDRGLRNNTGRKEFSMNAGTEPLSVVTQAWLGDWDGSFIERYRIQSLASALETKLTKTIREEYGGTYSIGVYPHLSVTPVPDYRFIVRYSCDPERVDELTDRVQEVVDSWRDTVPEAKFAEDIAANQRRSFSENLERNDWWLGQMTFAVATAMNPEDLMNREELYDTLSPELLRSTAARYLNDENYVEAVLYPDPLAVGEAFSD